MARRKPTAQDKMILSLAAWGRGCSAPQGSHRCPRCHRYSRTKVCPRCSDPLLTSTLYQPVGEPVEEEVLEHYARYKRVQ